MSKTSSTSRLLGFFVVIGALLLVQNLMQVEARLNKKIAEQERANQAMRTHINTYTHHQAQAQDWDKGFRPIEGVSDYLSLYRALNISQFGVETDIRRFRARKTEPVIVNGKAIGLTRICVDSGGGSLIITASDHAAVLQGLQRMGQRKDLSFERVTLNGARATPEVHLENFCMIMSHTKGGSV